MRQTILILNINFFDIIHNNYLSILSFRLFIDAWRRIFFFQWFFILYHVTIHLIDYSNTRFIRLFIFKTFLFLPLDNETLSLNSSMLATSKVVFASSSLCLVFSCVCSFQLDSTRSITSINLLDTLDFFSDKSLLIKIFQSTISVVSFYVTIFFVSDPWQKGILP